MLINDSCGSCFQGPIKLGEKEPFEHLTNDECSAIVWNPEVHKVDDNTYVVKVFDAIGEVGFERTVTAGSEAAAIEATKEHLAKVHVLWNGPQQPVKCKCAYFSPPQPKGGNFTGTAYVYAVANFTYDVIKVGYTLNPRMRVDQGFIARGWELIGVWEFNSPREAYRGEQKVIRGWRTSGWPIQSTPRSLKIQKGFTETVSTRHFASDPNASVQVIANARRYISSILKKQPISYSPQTTVAIPSLVNHCHQALSKMPNKTGSVDAIRLQLVNGSSLGIYKSYGKRQLLKMIQQTLLANQKPSGPFRLITKSKFNNQNVWSL